MVLGMNQLTALVTEQQGPAPRCTMRPLLGPALIHWALLQPGLDIICSAAIQSRKAHSAQPSEKAPRRAPGS